MDQEQDARRAKWLGRARDVAKVVAAAGGEIERTRELTPEVLAAMHDASLFRLLLPRSLGGAEIDLVTLAEVAEILAAADASTAWCFGQGSVCAMSAAFLEPEAARRLFGQRDAVLAWGAGIQGTAVEVPGGYRVSGRWSFASGSRHATLIGTHCSVVAATGEPRLRPDGRKQDRTALIPRSQVRMIDDWQVVGLRGTGSDSYEVKDHFVAAADTIDREVLTEAKSDATCFRITTTLSYAAAFGGVMLGIARGMLDDLKALAMTKTARGASSSLRESAMFQADLARLEARWRAARAYHLGTYGGLWRTMDNGGELTLDARVDARLAATHTINEACQIAVDGYRAAGQNAIFESAPFERRMRDALSASQQVQGRPSHFVTVGRHFLGLPPDTTMFI